MIFFKLVFAAISVSAQKCDSSLSMRQPKFRSGLMTNKKSAEAVTVANGWSDFFKNDNKLECPMKKCELKTSSSKC